MNISKLEQRVLHVLAQGGVIQHERDQGAKVTAVTCFTHNGQVLSDLTLPRFTKLRRKGRIHSAGGRPYRISRRGRLSVRAQLNNRT